MLAKVNRVVRADDFRATVRRGNRAASPHALVYVRPHESPDSADGAPTRFGFIVSKSVGNAVTRNLMARRFRAIGRDALANYPTGRDVVIRALPGSPDVSWTNLRTEILDGLERSASKQ